MFAVVQRATLLVPSGTATDPNRKHLTILLTDPIGPVKQVLTVTVSKVKGNRSDDRTCLLNAGDHAFIGIPSYVAYRWCRHDCTEAHILNCVGSRLFEPMEMLREDVFARVIEGLDKSPHTPPFAKKMIRGAN